MSKSRYRLTYIAQDTQTLVLHKNTQNTRAIFMSKQTYLSFKIILCYLLSKEENHGTRFQISHSVIQNDASICELKHYVFQCNLDWKGRALREQGTFCNVR